MYVLWRVIVKEFLQLSRDKKIIPIVFVAPAVQLLLFGYAANLDVTDVPLLLIDQDRTQASRRLVDRFLGSPYFELVGTEERTQAVGPWLVSGRAQVALVVDNGYGEAVASGRTPRVQVIADGSDSTSAVVGLGYANRIVEQESAELVRARLAEWIRRRAAGDSGGADRTTLTVASRRGATGLGLDTSASGAGPTASLPPGTIETVPRVWYNPDLESRWFYVPAVLAAILMIVTMVLSSMGVVREKEIGTMEQVIVTPIRSWQLIIGKLFPFAVIGFIDIFIVTGVAVLWFEIPLEGSFTVLVGTTMLFLMNTLGLGLLVSTVARTQQQAMMGSAFLLMVPMIYLSGLIFPIANMPETMQAITYAIPLRYYAVILRAVFLKGSGLDALCRGPEEGGTPRLAQPTASVSRSWRWRRRVSASASTEPGPTPWTAARTS